MDGSYFAFFLLLLQTRKEKSSKIKDIPHWLLGNCNGYFSARLSLPSSGSIDDLSTSSVWMFLFYFKARSLGWAEASQRQTMALLATAALWPSRSPRKASNFGQEQEEKEKNNFGYLESKTDKQNNFSSHLSVLYECHSLKLLHRINLALSFHCCNRNLNCLEGPAQTNS